MNEAEKWIEEMRKERYETLKALKGVEEKKLKVILNLCELLDRDYYDYLH